MIGVNLYAGQFGSGGTYGTTYIYPNNSYLDYYASRGMDLIRLPFDWERVQPVKDGPLSAVELGRIDAVIAHAGTLGMKVVLDPHGFGYGYGEMIGGGTSNASFADFWGKMAAHFVNDEHVIFGLMNEPHDQTATQWIASANAAVAAIREAGATQLILVPGTYWDGSYSWVNGAYDRPGSDDNDTVIGEGVIDPADNYAFEVHTYFDAKNSGTGPTISESKGVENLIDITEWAERTGHRLFQGEFGIGSSAMEMRALDNMMAYMDEHPVWIGAAYWAGGPWIGNYRFSIEPNSKDANGNPIDRPQMEILQRYDLDPLTNPAPIANVVAAIDAGGDGYIDDARQVAYAADGPTTRSVHLTGTSRTTNNQTFITATSEDALYQTTRYGKSFGYDIAVANGTYTVDFNFADSYWTEPGKRVFDVLLEGQAALSKVDIAAAVGDKNEAYLRSATVVVTDGLLNIRFDATRAGGMDNAIVAGFNIHRIGDAPPPPPLNPIDGTAAADTLTGSAAGDLIRALGGDDVVAAGSGDDTIEGGAGRDRINGEAGVDTMKGGAGDDSYFVDNAGDRAIELAGEGVDTVSADVSFTLSDQVEHLTLRTGAAINGTGNALGNKMQGNSGANALSGLDGNDFLWGKGGTDILTGGAGDDVFVFDTALGTSNVDRITDFAPGRDEIRLENAVFTALGATGPLAAAAFQTGAAATSAGVRIVYDAASGDLSYDPDGSGAGAAVVFARLSPGLALGAGDFVVI